MTRFTRALRSRTAAAAAAAGAAAVLAATFAQAQPAAAIPSAQEVCTMGSFAVTAARGFVPLTDPIHFVPDVDAIKAEVTADAGVDAGAEIRLGWTFSEDGVSGGPPLEGNFGPANFANHQQFFETRTTFALFHLVAGHNTTIQPWIRVSGPATASATVLHRCFTIEFATH